MTIQQLGATTPEDLLRDGTETEFVVSLALPGRQAFHSRPHGCGPHVHRAILVPTGGRIGVVLEGDGLVGVPARRALLAAQHVDGFIRLSVRSRTRDPASFDTPPLAAAQEEGRGGSDHLIA